MRLRPQLRQEQVAEATRAQAKVVYLRRPRSRWGADPPRGLAPNQEGGRSDPPAEERTPAERAGVNSSSVLSKR